MWTSPGQISELLLHFLLLCRQTCCLTLKNFGIRLKLQFLPVYLYFIYALRPVSPGNQTGEGGETLFHFLLMQQSGWQRWLTIYPALRLRVLSKCGMTVRGILNTSSVLSFVEKRLCYPLKWLWKADSSMSFVKDATWGWGTEFASLCLLAVNSQ